MKKQLLTLSLSTALSTALLTTFLPTTTLQASNASSSSDSGIVIEDEDAKVNPLLVKAHVGIAIDGTTLPSNDQFVIHNDTLKALKTEFTAIVVYFENDQAHFTFNLATDDTEAELIHTLEPSA